MPELVERLRFYECRCELVDFGKCEACLAADEIERLRVELNAWRRATKGAERLLDRARCEAKKERAEIERLRVEVAKRQALIDAWANTVSRSDLDSRIAYVEARDALYAAATKDATDGR